VQDAGVEEEGGGKFGAFKGANEAFVKAQVQYINQPWHWAQVRTKAVMVNNPRFVAFRESK